MLLIISVLLYCLHLNPILGEHLSKCDIFHNNETFIDVQCDGRNYSNFPLASTLPENTSVISFKNNKVNQLPNQPSHVLRDKVWNIDLSGNVIENLLDDKLGKTFSNVSNLDLSNNKLRLLSKNSFQHLTFLSVLNLSYNKLDSLSQNWFSHLSELSWLDLGHNRISVINETKHGWPSRLEKLDLSFNQLRTIPPLPTNASVNLISNPIFCGCDLGVNKEISETFVKVECHQLNYVKEPVQIQNGVTEYYKYRFSDNICKPVVIIHFSYVVVNEQIIITCVTSYSYPAAVLFIYHGSKVIKISVEHVTLNGKKPGLYTCKVTNYISSDQRELVIPGLTPPEANWTTELPENDETKNVHENLFTTTATKKADEKTIENQGRCA